LPENDPAQMAELVKELLQNRTRREAIGQAQRAHVLQEFGFDKSMRRYEQLIAQLTLGHNA
jgi:glycosyltransferase involved in cell wall biosynthesis